MDPDFNFFSSYKNIFVGGSLYLLSVKLVFLASGLLSLATCENRFLLAVECPPAKNLLFSLALPTASKNLIWTLAKT